MIYETQIKIKNYIIDIEFDTETEDFSYTIKERKSANAKIENKEKTGTNRDESKQSSGNNRPEPETEFDKL